MSTYMSIGLAVFVGFLTTVQAVVNTELGKHIGGVSAALVSFIVGTVALLAVFFISGETGFKNVAKVPYYLWLGGLLGATFVYSMIKLIPLIGAGATMAGVIAGQLVFAVIIDQFGWFGLQKISLDWTRGVGILLLLVGVKLLSK